MAQAERLHAARRSPEDGRIERGDAGIANPAVPGDQHRPAFGAGPMD